MDNRQRYDYDYDRGDRDREDNRYESGRGRERSGRDFMSNQPRYRESSEMSDIHRGREDFGRDRGQEQWSQNREDYDYGRGGSQRWGQSEPFDRQRQQWGQQGQEFGQGRQDERYDRWQSGRDWDQRNLPESYRQGRQGSERFRSDRGWDQQNYSDPYREYQGSSYGGGQGTMWGGGGFERNRYESSQQNYPTRTWQGTGTSGFGGSSNERNRDFGRDRNREYGNRSESFDRGREETLTEKVGRFFGMGPKGYRRSDDRVREDVSERLEDHPEIDATNIEVQVKDGEVTLTGTVDNRRAKRLAEDVAEQARGVRDVHNQIRVTIEGLGTTTGTETTSRRPATGTSGTEKTHAA